MKKIKYMIINISALIIILIGLGYVIYFLSTSNYLILIFTLIFLYLLNSIFSLIIFIQKKNYSAKTSWLLIIILFPIIGHMFFIFFGGKYSKRKTLMEYRKKTNFQFENLKNNFLIKDNDVKNLFNKQSKLSSRGIYQGEFKVFFTGDEAFRLLFNDLKNAKKFIHIHYYIIKYGEIFEEFQSILKTKALQGIKIRFIIDDFGKWAFPQNKLDELENCGIEICIFKKIYFPFIGFESSYRTHEKMVIIDGNIVHFGGINIADEYSNLKKKYGVWIDNYIKISGKAVRSYSLLFIEDWKFMAKKTLNYKKYLLETNQGKSYSILVEGSPEMSFPLLKNSLIMWIQNAKKTIYLSTPYLTPDNDFIDALKTAALSGVKIKIFFPGMSDKKAVYYSTKYWINELIKFNIQFYKTKNIFLHSKIGIFDDKYAYFGTANIDMRSFYSQFEILNFLAGPIIKDIKKIFNYYEQLSEKVTSKNLKMNWWKKIILIMYSNIFIIFM